MMRTFIYILFSSFLLVGYSCGNSNDKITDNSGLSSVEFDVSGMVCTECENAIKKSVSDLSGIVSVTSSFKDGNALVLFDKSKTNTDEITGAIEEIGYKVESFKELSK